MNEKKPNIIRDKSFAFALRIVNLYRFLAEKKEYVLSKQLLRSGTAVGALVREAEHAESKADFIHKMAIAQKEANETDYWIELLYQSEYLDISQYNSIEMLNKKRFLKLLYDNFVKNEDLANTLDEKIMSTKEDSWRDYKMRLRQVRNAIKEVLKDFGITEDEEVSRIFDIVKNQRDY